MKNWIAVINNGLIGLIGVLLNVIKYFSINCKRISLNIGYGIGFEFNYAIL